MTTNGTTFREPLIFDIGGEGRTGFALPALDVPDTDLADVLGGGNIRDSVPGFPRVSEVEVVRHFHRLSKWNYCIENGLYPLGSCTMKHNPRINEVLARLPGFVESHPLRPTSAAQGNLELLHHLSGLLAEITGLDAVTLHPCAGSHGELTGMMLVKKHFDTLGEKRKTVLIPDSAHGTNPATSAMSGMRVVELKSDSRGNVDLEALRAECDDTLAGLMLTNPNTLGLFDEHVSEVAEIVHQAGGLVYGDGANMNALLGIVRPGDLGIDILHYNLHKTFSTPHGGGGPGSGPVGVAPHLVDFLPAPVVAVVEEGDDEQAPLFGFETPVKTIGRVKAFNGHFGMMVRAFTYMRMHGEEGLRQIAEYAVLNANYLLARLRDSYHVPYDRICMHEFVAEGRWPEIADIRALDISKRLMDYGIHPPTNYFPLIVHESLMIEPTETESKQSLDAFADAMIKIAQEAQREPELLHNAPISTPVGRLDEVKAARDLVLRCAVDSES